MKEPPEKDELFASICIERGYVSQEELDEALEDLRVMAERGIEQFLPDVLVAKKLLTPEQRSEVVRLVRVQTGEARTIGDFEVVAKLGAGGMGVVYKAKSRTTGEWVALKTLPQVYANDGDYLDRFHRETKVLQTLRHQNIVRCVDAGYDEARKLHYCAMEFVEGETLSARIKREGVIPEAEALSVAGQIALALMHAHRKGLVHRDIKPQNIMITPEGLAKLLDMGLARQVVNEDNEITVSGVYVGSPHYSSPEQVRGEGDIDHRTDIYSLGATLYHAVTGKTPFQGKTAAEILSKHLTEDLPWPAKVNPKVSDSTCQLIERMMTKDARDRYQDAKDLLADIKAISEGETISAWKAAPGSSSINRDLKVEDKPATTRKSTRVSTKVRTRASEGVEDRTKIYAGVAGIVICFLAVGAYVYFGSGGTQATAPVVPVRANQPEVPVRANQPQVPVAPIGKPPVAEAPKVKPAATEGVKNTGDRLVLLDFEKPVRMESVYGQPVEICAEAAHSGKAGLKITMAPGMDTHQASRAEVTFPEIADFNQYEAIEFYVGVTGCNTNKGEVQPIRRSGERVGIAPDGAGWMYRYNEGGWQRFYFKINKKEELKDVKGVSLYFNYDRNPGPFSFCIDDIALLRGEAARAGEQTKTAVVPVTPAKPVVEFIGGGIAGETGKPGVQFSADFEDGVDGFDKGQWERAITNGGSAGALRAVVDLKDEWYPCAVRTDVELQGIPNAKGLFQMQDDTKIKLACWIEGADFVTVQFWDNEKNGNYYVNAGNLPQKKWNVVEVRPQDGTPCERDGTKPSTGDWVKNLQLFSGKPGQRCTLIVDDVSAYSGKAAETSASVSPLAGTIVPSVQSAVPKPDEIPAGVGKGFVSIFNGKDLTGWKADGAKLYVQDGALVVQEGQFEYAANWTEFTLAFELSGSGVDSLAGMRLAYVRNPTEDCRLRLTFYGDGDVHVWVGMEDIWRSGAGKVKLVDQWTPVRLELKADVLRIYSGETKIGEVNIARFPVKAGGIMFHSYPGKTARMRNIRVSVP